jgi:hypothetical protein
MLSQFQVNPEKLQGSLFCEAGERFQAFCCKMAALTSRNTLRPAGVFAGVLICLVRQVLFV